MAASPSFAWIEIYAEAIIPHMEKIGRRSLNAVVRVLLLIATTIGGFVGVLGLVVGMFLAIENVSGKFGDVQWRSGGSSERITVKVSSAKRVPTAGARVQTTSDSGDSHEGITDAAGIAHVSPGEAEVLRLKVNGVTVMNKDNAFECWVAPRMDDGLTFTVIWRTGK